VKRFSFGFSSMSFVFVTLFACLSLLGCHKKNSLLIRDENYKLPRKVAGSSDVKVATMIKKLNRTNCINIVTIGQDYLISMPSSALFPDESPRITWQGYAVLNKVVDFMKQFRKVGVTVTSYSSKYVSVAREQALTSARARHVADYLWSQGIDSRMIYSLGAGSDKPITDYAQRGDRSPSSRVEITFRDTIS
jgi:intracellular multiplication protein IcmN